jgi:spermidine/putrescine transport system ATP-binding protein
MSDNNSIIDLCHVSKSYDDTPVVKDLNLTVQSGEFLTLLGPSGCGKTTTLRMIAGFEAATEGEILLKGLNVSDYEPFDREVNTVFQNYALFPHMSVYENIAFGLQMKHVSKKEIRNRVSDMLNLIQLEGYESRSPAQLSGGQRQRVAIARALVNEPSVLLLDEPLGALDLKLRKQMQLELKRLQKKLAITFVYVTHDQEEALTMSDRIAIMNEGVLEQLGTPAEIYEKPQTKFVAGFIGESNIFEAQIAGVENNLISMMMESGFCTAARLAQRDKDKRPGEMVHLSIRPERLILSPKPLAGFSLPAMVREMTYVGNIIKAIAVLGNGQEIVCSKLSGTDLPKPGQAVYAGWEPEDVVVIPAERETAIFEMIDKVDLAQTQ